MPHPIEPADERVHAVDPDEPTWNESWFFSWIDTEGGPAGFFRLGVLPNQQRAMLWFFVNVDGAWLGIDESRIALDDLDLSNGVSYDQFGLRFAWVPRAGGREATFSFDASLLTRSGDGVGSYVPVAVDLACRATGDRYGTVHGDDDRESSYARSRFEQSLEASGVVGVDDARHEVRGGSHRDRSWGPRDWRLAFTMGDLQPGDRELFFVGAPGYDGGGGYIRERSGELTSLVGDQVTLGYDDEARTITPGRLGFVTTDGSRVDVDLAPIGQSIPFDMAHTCEEPETWLYYRTLVEAHVSGWERPCRGWLDASRYGIR